MRVRGTLCVVSVLASSAWATAQDGQVKKRLVPKEIEALPSQSAGAGTVRITRITTRVLFGDPAQAGLYTIELRVAPNTVIQAHTHRDMRHGRRRQRAVVFRVRTKERTGTRQGAAAGRVLYGAGWRVALCADRSRRCDSQHYRLWANRHRLGAVDCQEHEGARRHGGTIGDAVGA